MSDRAAIAADTLRLVELGGYINAAGENVRLADFVTAAKAGTRLYDDSVLVRRHKRRARPTRIQVVPEPMRIEFRVG